MPDRAHPFAADIDAERRGWYEVAELARSLTPAETLVPGYQRDPDWTARDVVGHLGAWLAEAALQFERILNGTYEGHDVDIDGLNAAFLGAMHDQSWETVWIQANAGRTRMLQIWTLLRVPDDEAAWWIRKAAVNHYDEHLPRLRTWVAEVRASRPGG